ncbi:MAG: glycosyltransferase family 9 protein, partial [Candidatus Firestonebacteria bacterium]
MYKFVNKKTKVIIFFIDIIGFVLWAMFHIFAPRKIIGKKPIPLKPGKILLIRADYIGDVLLTTHTLKAIRERFPDAHISFLVSSKSREILEGNPYIDTILTYDPPWFFKKGFVQAFREYFKILSLIRKEQFDLAADFRGDARNILLLMVFAKIPHRVSFAASGGWYLLTSIADYKESLHEAEYHTIIAENLGTKVSKNALPEIFITDKDRIFINNFLNKYGIKKDDMLVVIHPGARQAVRQWPESRYTEVGRYLIEEYGAKIILTGSREELLLMKRIKTLINGAVVIGATEINSFKQLTALFERCTLYIGVSSGPSHMAGVARLPSVLIFGPESVSQWHPLGNQYYIAKKGFPCCPCNQKRCPVEENCIES